MQHLLEKTIRKCKTQEETQKLEKTTKHNIKNYLLIGCLIAYQLYIFLRGADYKVVWLINGVKRTPSMVALLIITYFYHIIITYIAIKPKGVNKTLLLACFVLSILDLLAFVFVANVGVFEIKMFLLVCLTWVLRKKFSAWVGN